MLHAYGPVLPARGMQPSYLAERIPLRDFVMCIQVFMCLREKLLPFKVTARFMQAVMEMVPVLVHAMILLVETLLLREEVLRL